MKTLHPFRESISAICIAAAWTKGSINDQEKMALDRIHVQLGFSRAETMDLIGQALESGPSGENIAIPGDPEVQKEFMRFALAVCFADGFLDPHEVNFLAKLANFLALPPNVLQELRDKAEAIVKPTDRAEISTPARLDALLPEQLIRLDVPPEEAEQIRRDLSRERALCARKPLTELLYQGEDYGGEISLL